MSPPKPCLEPYCPVPTYRSRCTEHERAYERRRPGRHIYGRKWKAHSRRRRAEEPRCVIVGCEGTDLTVDHPTDAVLCRSHHAELENGRRRAARGGVGPLRLVSGTPDSSGRYTLNGRNEGPPWSR